DHKFDPITQRDYYALQAVFAGVRHGERPIRLTDPEPRRHEAALLRAELVALAHEALRDRGRQRTRPALLDWQKQLEARLAALEKPETVYAGTFGEPEPTHILKRGDPLQKGAEVGPAAVQAVGKPLQIDPQAPERERRLALAAWIGDADNPMPAR